MEGVTVTTMAERPDLIAPSDELSSLWPAYNGHGKVMNQFFWRVKGELPEFQVLLVDDATDRVVARGRTIPIAWDGTVDGLPAGIDGAIRLGFELKKAKGTTDTLCALAAEVASDHQGTGLSAEVLRAMRALADRYDLPRGLIAPVRPSWKDRYPTIPIERYSFWTRDDGLPFDPWMRVHIRIGGMILKPEPESLRITGTVEEWERWVGMAFPESGDYVFPQGLAPVEIDKEMDEGRYWEPNVWMLHK